MQKQFPKPLLEMSFGLLENCGPLTKITIKNFNFRILFLCISLKYKIISIITHVIKPVFNGLMPKSHHMVSNHCTSISHDILTQLCNFLGPVLFVLHLGIVTPYKNKVKSHLKCNNAH